MGFQNCDVTLISEYVTKCERFSRPIREASDVTMRAILPFPSVKWNNLLPHEVGTPIGPIRCKYESHALLQSIGLNQ